MSRQTTNYGLTKPDYTDTADIEVVNANMDIIDGALKVIDTKSNNVMSKNSSAWSSTVTYAVGQYCIYNNSLWKCLVQHSGQTPQEGTYWARVSLDTLGSEINALNSNLTIKTYNIRDNVPMYTYGKICLIHINIKLDLKVGWNELGTLPSNFSPLAQFEQIMLNGARKPQCWSRVFANNKVQIYSDVEYSGYIVGEIIYLAK